jgi:hypothetical protein
MNVFDIDDEFTVLGTFEVLSYGDIAWNGKIFRIYGSSGKLFDINVRNRMLRRDCLLKKKNERNDERN